MKQNTLEYNLLTFNLLSDKKALNTNGVQVKLGIVNKGINLTEDIKQSTAMSLSATVNI